MMLPGGGGNGLKMKGGTVTTGIRVGVGVGAAWVAVGVAVGAAVRVAVGVRVAVAVGACVTVGDGVTVRVRVAVGLAVKVAVAPPSYTIVSVGPVPPAASRALKTRSAGGTPTGFTPANTKPKFGAWPLCQARTVWVTSHCFQPAA